MSSVEILSKTAYVKTEPGNNNILCKMNGIYDHLFNEFEFLCSAGVCMGKLF